MHLIFATCHDLSRFFPANQEPLFSADDYLLAAYLRSKGHTITPWVWDAKEPLPGADAIIVRSTWDYSSLEKRVAFRNWLEATSKSGPLLLNPAKIQIYNMDKTYLLDLAHAGISIVPTTLIKPNDAIDLKQHFDYWGTLVIKPATSAGAHNTYRFTSKDELGAFEAKTFPPLLKTEPYLAQPYLEDIETRGEWSVIFLNNTYSHAVHKTPGKDQWFVQEKFGGSVHFEDPPAPILQLAYQSYEATIDKCKDLGLPKELLLYLRVDIVDAKALPMVGEIEAIEPQLFFRKPGSHQMDVNLEAAELFAKGVEKALRLQAQ